MHGNKQNVNISKPSGDVRRKVSLIPYFLDFIKYVSGFTVIIVIALVIIHVVSAT